MSDIVFVLMLSFLLLGFAFDSPGEVSEPIVIRDLETFAVIDDKKEVCFYSTGKCTYNYHMSTGGWISSDRSAEIGGKVSILCNSQQYRGSSRPTRLRGRVLDHEDCIYTVIGTKATD